MNNHWHVYDRDEIKPAMIGDCVYALAVPAGEGAFVERFVGQALRHSRVASLPGREQEALLLKYPYGMIFNAVAPEGIKDLEKPESLVEAVGYEIPCYNKQVISTARNLFLSKSSLPKGIDPLTFCLIQGLTHLLPTFNAFPRIPIAALKNPANQRGILIVEDQEDLLELFQVFLESMGYNNIYLAQDGTQALPILEARGAEIDLIVLNWEMPHMDGLTLMRWLAHDHPHTVGVIMESGYPHNQCKREFFKLGTDLVVPIDYLVKPFRLEEFQLEIRVAMEYVRRRKARRKT